VPDNTYSVESTTDVRDLQRIPTDGLVDGDDGADALVECTTVSCRYLWTTF
jgi:hypothetical protein